MRIVLVSALYPPNFIGGATLQAQRLARGLQSKGHEVQVFAGAKDPKRRPLETWSEIDETGLPIFWVATTPWLDFSSDRNHSNFEAEGVFNKYIETQQPDIVHFHALQGLGAGLVRTASLAGAKVVVTMHDWWWYCARQFLADRNFQPCSPVVDCGVCQCEVDRQWLDARRTMIEDSLVYADLVLAPSASAMRSLAANGMDPKRLEVDENGITQTSAPINPDPKPPRDRPLTFMYAGGPFELKGAHVLIEAAHLINTSEPWQLNAYGLSTFVDGRGLKVDQSKIKILNPFKSDEAEAAFGAADVLVVPSVMRESHSLITREALNRGLPVICSDSLGPEEVVIHGVNGLVVASADPVALANAMTSAIEDRELVGNLKANCNAVPIRSLQDQVDGLVVRYSRLVTSPQPVRSSKINSVLFIVGIEGAPLRYRARLPAEALRLIGIDSQVRHYQDPGLAGILASFDAVVVYRAPATTRLMGLLDDARSRKIPIIFDVDDLIFDPTIAEDIPAVRLLAKHEAEKWIEGVHRYRITMEACDLFVGSTKTLCDHVGSVVGLPTERFANGVGLRMSQLSDAALQRPRIPGPPRVAYFSGTDTHDDDWHFVEPALIAALEAVPDAELWMIGSLPVTDATRSLGGRLHRFGMQQWDELPDLLRQIDINLAPLEPGSRFNEAKSAIKWLEAALAATPTVASPTDPFVEAITDGHDGRLAHTAKDWTDRIVELLLDDEARVRIGNSARRTALLRWSPWLQGRRYAEILDRAHDLVQLGAPVNLVSATERSINLVHDEPTSTSPLEPYDLTSTFRRDVPAMPTQPVTFSFPCGHDGLTRIDLLLTNSHDRPATLTLHIAGQRKSSITEVAANDPTWAAFTFDPIEETKGKQIEVSVEPHVGGSVSIWTNAQGAVCLRAWSVPGETRWHPTETPASPSITQRLRAKLRYGTYVLRTRGPKSFASWLKGTIQARLRARRPRRHT
ncbi:MAG: glycosyltransferase [Actinomycetota bacterium]